MAEKTGRRAPGTPNRKSHYVRDKELKIRCTEGLIDTIAALKRTGLYKSDADVIHDAVQQLGYKKLTSSHDKHLVTKIQ